MGEENIWERRIYGRGEYIGRGEYMRGECHKKIDRRIYEYMGV